MVAASTSIPTKFQTLVTSNADKKGFSSQAKRFPSDIYMVGYFFCFLFCLIIMLPRYSNNYDRLMNISILNFKIEI